MFFLLARKSKIIVISGHFNNLATQKCWNYVYKMAKNNRNCTWIIFWIFRYEFPKYTIAILWPKPVWRDAHRQKSNFIIHMVDMCFRIKNLSNVYRAAQSEYPWSILCFRFHPQMCVCVVFKIHHFLLVFDIFISYILIAPHFFAHTPIHKRLMHNHNILMAFVLPLMI